MYTIIGGDGKQYGPISGEEIRKWIQEHRLNGQSQARAEGETDFRPLSTFSEFADLLTTSSPIETGHVSGSDDWLTRDYELDIAGCVSRGWKLFNDNAGTLWGGAIVAFIIIAVACFFLGFIYNLVTAFIIPKALLTSWVARTIINIPLQFLMALVIGPMLGGIYYIFLQRLRGQPAGLGDIFAGFQKSFSQLFLGHFVISFIASLCMLPYNIAYMDRVMPIIEQMQHSDPSAAQSAVIQFWGATLHSLPILLLCMIPAMYLSINWQFSLPLIVDKNLGFWDAMKASWKKVHKHWLYVFGLAVVVGLINMAGFLLCCVGLLYTVPMTIGVTMCAYETIFGSRQSG